MIAKAGGNHWPVPATWGMEKVGIHKRDIMVDRVKSARDTQRETKAQFLSTMEQFRRVVNFDGGDLEKEYNQLKSTLEKSEEKAEAVRKRIESVEDVSKALFTEWRTEIRRYSSDSLRRLSQATLDQSKKRYSELIAAMKRAEGKLEPALVPLRDQVLFSTTISTHGPSPALGMSWQGFRPMWTTGFATWNDPLPRRMPLSPPCNKSDHC